jgi:hypothetical protein
VLIPVACTLSPLAASERLEEWRAFFARWHAVGGRTEAHTLRVRLDASRRAREEAADLARREKACCAFFEFSIEDGAESHWVIVQALPDASAILDEFVAMLPPRP